MTAITATFASTLRWSVDGARGRARRPDGGRVERAGERRRGLTIEAIAAVDTPREFRLHPRDRIVAYTAEAAGARQLFTLVAARGAPDPADRLGEARLRPAVVARRPPPGLRPRRRDLGHRSRRLAADPGRRQARRRRPQPRWSPDGRRLAFLSRRRGWSQVWLIDAPVPRRGRPAAEPKPPEPTVLTEPGVDVERFEWAPDGNRIAVMAQRARRPDETSQIALVDVATGSTRDRRRRATAWTSAPAGCPMARSSTSRTPTAGSRSFGDRRRARPDRADRRRARTRRAMAADRVSPAAIAGRQPVRPRRGPRRGSRTCSSAARARVAAQSAGAAGRRRRRGPCRRGVGRRRINPWDGVWRSVGWLPDGAWVAAIGENETHPQDLWLLPVPGVAPDDAAAAPGHRLAAGGPPRRARAGPRPGRRARRGHGPRRAPDRGHPLAAGRRRPANAAASACRRSSMRTAARPGRRSAASRRSSSASWPRGSRSSTSTSADRPATAGRSATPTTASGATPTSTT